MGKRAQEFQQNGDREHPLGDASFSTPVDRIIYIMENMDGSRARKAYMELD